MNMHRFTASAALIAVSVLAACSASPPAPASPPILADSAPTTPPDTAPPPTIEPSATPNPIRNPTITITGEEEIVYQWARDRCESENVADLGARAFRDAGGQVHLTLSHYVTYQMLGPDLDHVSIDCNGPIFTSEYDRDPALYIDSQWLTSPYTEDGQTVYALVHNEWRGQGKFGACPTGTFDSCLDTSITMAISTDGGMHFQHIADPPAHLVATLPYKAQAGAGPFGMRNPSNIIKAQDGYYYFFSNISQYQTEEQWVCVMRSDDLSEPQSWRFWDGHEFRGEIINPYLIASFSPAEHRCEALDWNDIGASLSDSITWNTYLNRYVLVGISADQIDGREVWGFFYSFSDDLVHWSHRKLLTEIALPWLVADNTDVSYLYPTLLDPQSDARNFDTTGETAYLYYTRHNHGQGSLDRDLIRVQVTFGSD